MTLPAGACSAAAALLVLIQANFGVRRLVAAFYLITLHVVVSSGQFAIDSPENGRRGVFSRHFALGKTTIEKESGDKSPHSIGLAACFRARRDEIGRAHV